MKFTPRQYQQFAIQKAIAEPNNGFFLQVGLGKSVIALTALEHLVGTTEVLKPLVIAPKLVTEQTWPDEIEKWDHLRWMRISVIAGTRKQREAAIDQDADVWAVSRDNIAWLVEHCLAQRGRRWPFDMLIIDELSSFKNHDTRRFKALRKTLPQVKRVVGLTGTPAPNGLVDLWSQIFLLDQGERLGKTVTEYRKNYLFPHPSGFGYVDRPGAEKIVYAKLKDLCVSMLSKDLLDLPGRSDVIERVHLANMSKYKEFKKKQSLLLDEGVEITPLSAAALYNKLLQFSNGAVYDGDRNVHLVDETKLSAMLESYEALGGQPVIIFYAFLHDKERILEAIPEAHTLDGPETIRAWSRGEVPALVMHPAGGGHGLNLQDGGHHMFWYGLPWSLELYEQSVGRVDRSGQRMCVVNKIFIGHGTAEEVVAERLNDKSVRQQDLMNALVAHVKS